MFIDRRRYDSVVGSSSISVSVRRVSTVYARRDSRAHVLVARVRNNGRPSNGRRATSVCESYDRRTDPQSERRAFGAFATIVAGTARRIEKMSLRRACVTHDNCNNPRARAYVCRAIARVQWYNSGEAIPGSRPRARETASTVELIFEKPYAARTPFRHRRGVSCDGYAAKVGNRAGAAVGPDVTSLSESVRARGTRRRLVKTVRFSSDVTPSERMPRWCPCGVVITKITIATSLTRPETIELCV